MGATERWLNVGIDVEMVDAERIVLETLRAGAGRMAASFEVIDGIHDAVRETLRQSAGRRLPACSAVTTGASIDVATALSRDMQKRLAAACAVLLRFEDALGTPGAARGKRRRRRQPARARRRQARAGKELKRDETD